MHGSSDRQLQPEIANGAIALATSVKDISISIRWFKCVPGFEEIFDAPGSGWTEVTTTSGDDVQRYDCGEGLAYTAKDRSIREFGDKGK